MSLDDYQICKDKVTVGPFRKFEKAIEDREVVSQHKATFNALFGPVKDSDLIMVVWWEYAVGYCELAKVGLPTEEE